MDGKVFVKTSSSRAPVRIYSVEDLQIIFEFYGGKNLLQGRSETLLIRIEYFFCVCVCVFFFPKVSVRKSEFLKSHVASVFINQIEHEKLFVAQCSWSQGHNKEKEHILLSKRLGRLFQFFTGNLFEVNDESIWKTEWGGQIVFSHGSRLAKECAF